MLEIPFPSFGFHKLIIVVKGHSFTGKAPIARRIGEWANCQVCYIDDFLKTLSLEKSYTISFPPSKEEADRLHHLATEALYTVALRYLHFSSRVVIKSRLTSGFELDVFIRMFNKCPDLFNTNVVVIIIECEIQNEYRWRSQLETVKIYDRKLEIMKMSRKEWYKINSWTDLETLKEDCIDSEAFGRHLLNSLEVDHRGRVPHITRLVLDYYNDCNVGRGDLHFELTQDFKNALIYLLARHAKGELSIGKYKIRYVALFQFDQVRRYLLEQELDAVRERSQYLCSKENTNAGCCVFKYRDEFEGSCCRVCEEEVVSGRPAYACHFCILTLHKSCAETALSVPFLKRVHDEHQPLFCYEDELRSSFEMKSIACKSCIEKTGKSLYKHCQTCIFETHLRRGVLPTIINHDCHPLHFLSLHCLSYIDKETCNACGECQHIVGYVCRICNVYYDMVCAFLPDEVKQEHGGHEHVLKLIYSREGVREQEDDHWCNGCYKEMDPQSWFYYCQECPYYVTHASVECVGRDRIQEAKSKGNVPIKQIREKFNPR